MACIVGSALTKPNSSCGRSRVQPNGPSTMKLADSQPDSANEGSSIVWIQTAKPSSRPTMAPFDVPCFQYMPISIDGANCATAVNDTSPIADSACDSPAAR